MISSIRVFAIVGVALPVLSFAQSPASPISIAPRSLAPIATIDERFQSFNVEMIEVTGGRFWAPYKAQTSAPPDTAQAAPGGMPASLYRYRPPVDLANTRLRKLATALGPMYIRVSGTWANATFFHDSDDPAPSKPPEGFNGVLTRTQWRSVIDFDNATNAQIVTSFAVSQGARNGSEVWTSTEADKVLRFTQSAGGRIAAAELFNEPTFASIGGVPKGYDAATYGRDMRAFHAWAKKAAPHMQILGPGSVGEAGGLGTPPGMKMLHSEDLLKEEGPDLLDAFSYHFYGGVSQRCSSMGPPSMRLSSHNALTADWLLRTNRDEVYYAALRDKFAPGRPIWLTETGEAACGGDPWAADFIDTFRYLNQLGSLARKGVKVVMHNTLDASDYGVIDESTLIPRPNYWAAVLWRRLMGTTVLDAGESHDNFYVYAHCLRSHRGGVALLAINADKTGTHELSLPAASQRYTLTSTDLLSSTVQLNGIDLQVTATGDLPSLTAANQTKGSVALAPASITFFAIPDAHNSACH